MKLVIKGAFLNVVMRWTDRLVGVISTVILARLLVPADFGVVSMAMLFIELINVFFDLGVHIALLQNNKLTQEHYDTAWTLRLIQTSIATVLVFFLAPLAGEYFKEPRVTAVLQVLAFSFIIGGLENIGIVDYQKNLQFGLDFKFNLIKRLSGFFATIIAAWFLRSYWAIIIGVFVLRCSGSIISYRMITMRPRFSFAKLGEIFSVSQWMVVRSIGSYLEGNLHRIIVGRRESSGVMGAYTLANEISAMPSTELLAPLNRVLFPAFVKVKHDLNELKRIYLLSQGLQILVGLPAGVGLALVAKEVVLLMLGAKWGMAVSFVQLLAIVNVFISITTSGGYVLLTLGKNRTIAIYTLFLVAIFATGIFGFVSSGGAMQVAALRLIVSAVGLVVFQVLLFRAVPVLCVGDVLRSLIRPLVGVGIMAISVIGVSQFLPDLPIVVLLTKLVVGCTSYVLAVLAMWYFWGGPKGAETYLLEQLGLKAVVAKMRRATSTV